MKTTMKHCASLLLLAVTAIAALASCSGNDVTDGDRLPDGKYPMTFTATGLEAMATSRATADGTWNGNEVVAVMIGSEVRKYTSKTSESNSTTLEVAYGNTPFYWQTNNDKKTVSAWYPYATPPSDGDKRPANFTVQTDQQSVSSSDGYQKSDFLFANPVEVSFGGSEGLTFKHLPAKVLIKLKADAGSGVTTGDVETATVTIVNQATEGAITYDGTTGAATVTQAAEGTADITPKTMTTGSGYQKTVQALLVPRQMKNKQFIKVAIDNRNYYYIPTNDDANLQSGLQYTYEITVKKEGISVSKVSGTWTDEDWGSSDAKPATFNIHLSTAFTATTNTTNCKVTDANGNVLTATDGVYTAPSNEINFSITADEGYILSRFRTKKQKGSDYNEESSYAAATRTYTCCLYVRSDLWLENIEVKEFDISNPPDPEVGDYYYTDGTWSVFLLPQLTIAGIVFKVGAGNGDTANYGDKLINSTIHGYAVALNDVSSIQKWGPYGEYVFSEFKGFDTYNGYENTNTLKNKGGDAYPAAYQCTIYSPSAPETSSGWYLPSYAQLEDIFDLYTFLSSKTSFTSLMNDNYWTSTEEKPGTWNGQGSYIVNFGNSKPQDPELVSKDWEIYVRAILTF